jgi:hypothetical protein
MRRIDGGAADITADLPGHSFFCGRPIPLQSPREARWSLVRPAVVAGTAVLALLDNLAGLLAEVKVVFPHLLYVPIALASYRYPRRGTLIAAGIAAAYAAMARTLAPSEWLTIAARAVTLIAVGALVRAASGGSSVVWKNGFYVIPAAHHAAEHQANGRACLIEKRLVAR